MKFTSEQQHIRMTQTPIPQLVTSLAIPTTASQIVSVVYNTADTYFVAQIGTSAAAAVGVVFSLMSIIQAFGFGVGMGTAGAAIATMLSQCVSFGMLAAVFLSGRSIVRLEVRCVSRRVEDYLLIFRTGVPTICRQGLASLATALLNVQAAVFGDAAVAALTIANKIYLLVRNIVIGIGQGFQPAAGYNFGAGNKKRVREAFYFSCGLGTVLCVGSAAAIALGAPAVIGWFRADAEVVRIGTAALYFACAVMPFLAYSTFVNQLFQCLGFSASATFLACCRQGVCYLPLILLLPRIFGLAGVQAVQPAADFLTLLISIPFQLAFFHTVLADTECGCAL